MKVQGTRNAAVKNMMLTFLAATTYAIAREPVPAKARYMGQPRTAGTLSNLAAARRLRRMF